MSLSRHIKQFLPRTLFGRSLLIIITPILLLQIIVTVVFFDRHWTTMTDRLASGLAGEISFISKKLEENPEQNLEDIKRSGAEHLSLLISYDAGQTLIMGEDLKGWATGNLAKAIENDVGRPFYIRPHDKDKWIEISIQLKDGVLRILCPQYRLFSSSTYIFLLWMLGSSIVLLMIAIIFLRNQIRPIHKLATAAERFGKGQDVARYKPGGALEVRRAAQAFLDMKERIQRQVEQRTSMLSGVSHDLRTALTRMKLQLEILGDSPDVEALKNDVTEMERMVAGYLAFAKGDGEERPEICNLSDLLNAITTNARRNNRDIQLQCEENLTLRVKPQALDRAITNLVSNACKYADHIWVQAYIQGDHIEITIDDDGPGIPDTLKEEVFKPFVRGEASRNPKTGGVGLGLSIAQDIIHSHGGELLLEDSNRGGLRAVIRLPV